ncbi:MAG: TolC family protein [Proteobacteria bacterium]|nr:TolC family protein [Pseudomonadota bacterium]
MNVRQFICVSFLVGFAFIPASKVFAESLTLELFLSQIRSGNPELQSSKLRAEALEQRIEPAGSLDDPFVAAGVDEVPFGGGDEYVRRYQVSQSIPFPGKRAAKAAIAESRALSAHSDAETANREVTVLATQVFYKTYYNTKSLELNDKLKQLIQSSVASIQSHYKTGEANHHDVLLAKIEGSILDIERLRLSREQKILHALLNELRNLPPEAPVEALSVQFCNNDLQEPEVPDLKDQPELKALGYNVMQAEKEQNLAELAYFPDFVIQGMAMQPNSNMMDRRSNWGVMVGVNVPLYFEGKQAPLEAAAAIDKRASVLEEKKIKNRLNTEAIDAKKQFETARDVVALYRTEVIPSTELAAKSAQIDYVAKRISLTQYLDVLKVQRTQELEYLAAQIDVELARTRLKELLSAPPILKLAPAKPSLFGTSPMRGGGMGGGDTVSDTVSMGRGMSGPSRKSRSSSGMGENRNFGMGGGM